MDWEIYVLMGGVCLLIFSGLVWALAASRRKGPSSMVLPYSLLSVSIAIFAVPALAGLAQGHSLSVRLACGLSVVGMVSSLGAVVLWIAAVREEGRQVRRWRMGNVLCWCGLVLVSLGYFLAYGIDSSWSGLGAVAGWME